MQPLAANARTANTAVLASQPRDATNANGDRKSGRGRFTPLALSECGAALQKSNARFFSFALKEAAFLEARASGVAMATYITTDCINCGACEPECPNEAISEGEEIYLIDPELCTECVGFYDHEACQAVCPVECCLPDPKHVEVEKELLDRAVRLHAEDAALKQRAVANEFPSRFRK